MIPAPEASAERLELKYRLDLPAYHRVRCALRGATRHDRFSQLRPDHRYFVRSLYFDTDDYQAYEDKVAGVAHRIKLRLRTYSPDRRRAEFVRLELKVRNADRIRKFCARISLGEYDRFMRTGSWLDDPGPVAEEFRRRVLLKALRPRVAVEYQREALVPIDGSDVRITFDHGMRFARAETLFPERAFFHRARPPLVVMEIKSAGGPPRWLERVVRAHELLSVPNSKYAWGIEQSQHSIFCWYPR